MSPRIIPLSFLLLSLLHLSHSTEWHPEAKLSFVDYCQNLNYSVQQHTINTKDGYILTYFRLQAQNTTIFRSDLPIILFHHGFIDSSDTWVMNSDPIHNAPAFYFADQGFDVWLGNSRGNKHGRAHVFLNPDKNEAFWDFSWQEMAEFDLPAGFEYITKYTNQPKINYIGHSQGTILMFAALSERNEVVRSRLKKFIALGPLTSLAHEKSPLFSLVASEKLSNILSRFGVTEVFGDNWFTSSITILACRVANVICSAGLLVLSDMKPQLDSVERMDVIMGHYPTGTSLRDFNHFVQMTETNDFVKYDFRNETENMRRYGQKTPPRLNLSEIEEEVHLYVGKYDELADLEDFYDMVGKLNRTKNLTVTEIEGGHATFLWGKNMDFLENVLQQIKE